MLTGWLAIVGDDPGGATTGLAGDGSSSTTVQVSMSVVNAVASKGRAHQAGGSGEEQGTLHPFQQSGIG